MPLGQYSFTLGDTGTHTFLSGGNTGCERGSFTKAVKLRSFTVTCHNAGTTTIKPVVWNEDGTKLAEGPAVSITGVVGELYELDFGTPVDLAAGVNYRIGFHSSWDFCRVHGGAAMHTHTTTYADFAEAQGEMYWASGDAFPNGTISYEIAGGMSFDAAEPAGALKGAITGVGTVQGSPTVSSNSPRVRSDYVFGTIDAALTATDTTLSSPELARLPAVASPNIAAITLHDSATGIYEIVHVTAHAASATMATIRRAAEGSGARSWPTGASWSHGLTVNDLARKAEVSHAHSVSLDDLTDVDTTTKAPSSGQGLRYNGTGWAPANITEPTSLSSNYKGDWVSTTTYAKGNTVLYGGDQWEAGVGSTNVTPGSPPVDVYVGGPSSPGAALAAETAQGFISSVAGTFDRIRYANNGAARVGFARSKPTSRTSVDWISYADVGSSGGAFAIATLTTPLTLEEGQEFWAVAIQTGGNAYAVNGGAPVNATLTGGDTWFAENFTSTIAGWVSSIQAVRTDTPWLKALDLPASATALDDLSDVAVAGATDGQLLTYKAATATWEPTGPIVHHGTAAPETARPAASHPWQFYIKHS